jgi:hypothetical protein
MYTQTWLNDRWSYIKAISPKSESAQCMMRSCRRPWDTPRFSAWLIWGVAKATSFFHYGQPALYVGLDQNAAPLHEAHRIRWKADYRDVHFIQEIVGTYDLTAAVSLFSTELTWPPTANQRYYEVTGCKF